MPDLQMAAIEKRYGDSEFSLREINLSVREGEFFFLLGPSGCGKTSLLKLVAGLLEPDRGEIRLGEQLITHVAPEKRGFGMVFQQPLLFPHLTVEDNVAFALKMQGVGKKERLWQAHDMLAAVGLAGFARRHPSELSGGQQQRVSLARALVSRPRLLLMDEPFSALDPELRAEMRELVGRLHREHRLTILFVTHDHEEAFELADRIGVMMEGSLMQVGTPHEVYKRPTTPQIARFIGARNVIAGSVSKGVFVAEESEFQAAVLPSTLERNGYLILRPEVLQVPEGGSKPSVRAEDSRGRLTCVVKQSVFRQGFEHVKLDSGGQLLEVVRQAGSTSLLQAGSVVDVEYDLHQVEFLNK